LFFREAFVAFSVGHDFLSLLLRVKFAVLFVELLSPSLERRQSLIP
jgi:hypothetical protein